MRLPGKESIAPATTFHGLHHLRALAILLVFLFHYQIPMFGHPEWLPDWAKFGWTGVDLFFVLSGFLISSQLFRTMQTQGRVDFRSFFIKRFFRILPLYWAVLAIYFLLPAFHEREALPPLYKFLTFTQNFGLNLRLQGTFSHAWSLCVEEHFYLALPVVLTLLYAAGIIKRGIWLLPVLFLFGIGIRHYGWTQLYEPSLDTGDSGINWYRYIYYPTYNRLDGLQTGVAIAALYVYRPLVFERVARFGNLLVVAGLLVLTGAYFLCYEEHSYAASVFGFPVVALGYGLLVIGAVSPACFLYKWRSRATALIATLSYGIYLTHKGVIHITQNLLSGVDADSNVMLLVCMGVCVAVAFITYKLVEQPFMTLRGKLLKHSHHNVILNKP